MTESFGRTLPGLGCFDFTITRRRVRHQGMQQMLGGMSHIVNSAIKRFLIRLRGFGEPAQLANELKR